MKIVIEVTDEQLKEVECEQDLLNKLEADLRVKFNSLLEHIYNQGHNQGIAEADDYYDHANCGCC